MVRYPSYPQPLRVSRIVIAAAVVGHYFSRFISPFVLPLGPADILPSHERPVVPSIDYSNEALTVKCTYSEFFVLFLITSALLCFLDGACLANDSNLCLKAGKLKKIYERITAGQEPLIQGPETVVFGNDGSMYILSENAKLIKLVDFEEQEDGLSILTTATEIMDLGIGRPLGAKFSPDGTLYIADSILGLVRVKYPERAGAKVELVASRVRVDGHWSPINYADDVVVGKSGKVYFSDATDISPDKYNGKWDCIYASKLDLVRGGPRRGRILEYNPANDEVRVLVDGIHFANGISVSQDEQFVLVSETFQARTLKYYLEGPKKGNLEPIYPSYPAFSDGVDCNPSSGLCYVALPAPPGIMSIIHMIPHPIDRYVRTLLMTLPRYIAPKPPSFGGIAEIDPGDALKEQRLVRLLLDPSGKDVPFVTGITVHKGKVYLGFYKGNFVGVYDL
jgi:sugar lactone lactonase YvrE